MENIFKGTGVALVTPFKKDETIDFDCLRGLVQMQIEGGTDFLVVQGTTGESPTLTAEEKQEVLNHVVDENKGRLPIVYGVGGNNTRNVGAALQQLPKGIDGILSVSPYYNKPIQKGIIEHYKYIASCTSLPIILYNVPGRTGSNMTSDTTLELSKINNIVAMKEASGNMEQIMEIIRLRDSEFGVLSGDDALTMPLIASGADGVISVVANAFPKLFSKMVKAALNGDYTTSRKYHYELLPVTKMFFEEGNPGGVKIALETLNVIQAKMRLPLFEVSHQLRERIQMETKRLNNIN
jgi:4-hydroxy-tetrahydrodipicolinate synthase